MNLVGAGETLVIAELGFRTLLPGKSNLSHLVQSALKLFEVYVHQQPTKLRENVLRVRNMNHMGQTQLLIRFFSYRHSMNWKRMNSLKQL